MRKMWSRKGPLPTRTSFVVIFSACHLVRHGRTDGAAVLGRRGIIHTLHRIGNAEAMCRLSPNLAGLTSLQQRGILQGAVRAGPGFGRVVLAVVEIALFLCAGRVLVTVKNSFHHRRLWRYCRYVFHTL